MKHYRLVLYSCHMAIDGCILAFDVGKGRMIEGFDSACERRGIDQEKHQSAMKSRREEWESLRGRFLRVLLNNLSEVRCVVATPPSWCGK